MGSCYSYRQFCSLGPLPPRTPARPDPQVPKDRKLGPCSHGKIGAFYFYAEGSQDDPAFGFCEIELSLQRLAENKVRLELYCIADGYQSAWGRRPTSAEDRGACRRGNFGPRELAFPECDLWPCRSHAFCGGP